MTIANNSSFASEKRSRVVADSKVSCDFSAIHRQMDSKLVEKALLELREDDSRRDQSLQQFREWLAKHPFLSQVRQGKNRKYKPESLDNVCFRRCSFAQSSAGSKVQHDRSF
jgi:hypothetical protein